MDSKGSHPLVGDYQGGKAPLIAVGRTRTGTLLPKVDFESTASTNSATTAQNKY